MAFLSDLINLNLSDTTEKIIAEYIWIGGSGMDMRSKTRTIPSAVNDPSKLPKWNYGGSSTGQTSGEDSEVILYPQAIFKDPFRRGNNILVTCDPYTPTGEPVPTNKRCKAAKTFSHPDVDAEVPWYGFEQEYTLLQKDVKWPLRWPIDGYPGCGVSADKALGRDIVDSHYQACLYAGINISGINGEVMPGQGVANRGASIHVGSETEKGKGFFEDRRSASDTDPHPVEAMRTSTNPSYKLSLLVVFSRNNGKIGVTRMDVFQFVFLCI